MKFDPNSLALAIMLLWTPLMVFVRPSMRERLKNPIRNRSATIGRMVLTPINWIDMIRAGAGVWVLRELAITAEPGVLGLGTLLIVVLSAILSIGILSQSVWHDEELIVIGPLFYLAGITAILLPWPVGLFAILLGVTLAQMFSRLHWAFVIVPMLLGLFATAFGGIGLLLAVNCVLYVLPFLIAIGGETPVAFMHGKSALDRIRVPHARL